MCSVRWRHEQWSLDGSTPLWRKKRHRVAASLVYRAASERTWICSGFQRTRIPSANSKSQFRPGMMSLGLHKAIVMKTYRTRHRVIATDHCKVASYKSELTGDLSLDAMSYREPVQYTVVHFTTALIKTTLLGLMDVDLNDKETRWKSFLQIPFTWQNISFASLLEL